ncbi:MAG: hypothetical protein WDM76_12200 [Limisphaerales bacterium]
MPALTGKKYPHPSKWMNWDLRTSPGWKNYYQTKIRPVADAVGTRPRAHPFPQLLNKSLNLMVRLEMAARGGGNPLKHLARRAMPGDSTATHPIAAHRWLP